MSAESATFQQQVEAIARECATILIANKAINRPTLFLRLLQVQTKNTRRSWGGLTRKQRGKLQRPRISIAKRYATATGEFREYRAIADDPEIGSFRSNQTEQHIAAVVAHEIAHAADYWDGDRTGHGSEWRYRYRILRRALKLTRADLAGTVSHIA